MLQGGVELTPECRDMDRRFLAAAPDGPVVVVPLAASPGADYDGARRRAEAYFADLGVDAAVAPDARKEPDAAAELVRRAGAVVLPGGSPRRLRDALASTPVGPALTERVAGGMPVMGASAGAMVLCATTLLPQWRGDPATGPGLGVVTGYVVVPHYEPRRRAWVRVALSTGNAVLGIPEQSGVVVDDEGALTAVGTSASVLVTADGQVELPLAVWPPASDQA
jgi:cyanophycinase